MKIRSRYFVAAALLALVAPSVFMAASGKNDMAATARDISVINAVFKEMNTRYVDSVDVDRAMTTAIDAMLNDLDPYTEFISAEEASDFMAMSTTGEYGVLQVQSIAANWSKPLPKIVSCRYHLGPTPTAKTSR